MKNNTGYAVIILMLIISSVFSINLFMRQRAQKDLLDIHKFPHKLDGWTGKDLEIIERDYRILETRNIIYRDYANAKGKRLGMFMVYSETNRSVFHPPEVCLIGSGINIMDKRPEKIEFDGRSFFVSKLYLEQGKSRELVLYCYKAAGLYTNSYPLQQAYFALHQLFGKRTQGATIRLSMALGKDEKTTLSALKKFLIQTVKAVENL